MREGEIRRKKKSTFANLTLADESVANNNVKAYFTPTTETAHPRLKY